MKSTDLHFKSGSRKSGSTEKKQQDSLQFSIHVISFSMHEQRKTLEITRSVPSIESKFTGRTDAEAPIVRPLDVKIQLTGKDLDAWKD